MYITYCGQTYYARTEADVRWLSFALPYRAWRRSWFAA